MSEMGRNRRQPRPKVSTRRGIYDADAPEALDCGGGGDEASRAFEGSGRVFCFEIVFEELHPGLVIGYRNDHVAVD